MSTGPLVHFDTVTTQEVVALTSDLPVGGVSGEQSRTLARTIVRVAAGDVLKVAGWQRVTNDIGPKTYTVGVGFWIDVYDTDDGLNTSHPDKVWLRISSLDGQNVDRSVVHHLPLNIEGVTWTVPATWPTGHRAVVCFRADAHSTAWNLNGGGDRISVDDYGVLTVDQYKPAPPPVEDPRWAALQTDVNNILNRLTALESPTGTEC